MVLPILLIIAAILISNIMYDDGSQTPPITMSLSSYKQQTVLYTDTDAAKVHFLLNLNYN